MVAPERMNTEHAIRFAENAPGFTDKPLARTKFVFAVYAEWSVSSVNCIRLMVSRK
jgi:hypothetical protein